MEQDLSNDTSDTNAPDPADRHEGSAAVQLSGPAVLATWIISIAVHSLIFVIMFLVPWLSGMASQDDLLPIPNAELLGELQEASMANVQSPDLADHAPATVEELRFTPKRFTGLSALDAPSKPKLDIVGIGAGGGDFDRFGLGDGGASGPQFFRLGGKATQARSVVYVVDKSGSMLETFTAVQEELKKSISKLRRSQKFHVIFFSSKAYESPAKRLVAAIAAQKRRSFEFIDGVSPSGDTNPTKAMKRAFELKPDLIFFLTDGEFDRDLLPKLARWNQRRRVRLFTFAYVSREGAVLLEEIAREHNGEYRFVSEDELFD